MKRERKEKEKRRKEKEKRKKDKNERERDSVFNRKWKMQGIHLVCVMSKESCKKFAQQTAVEFYLANGSN